MVVGFAFLMTIPLIVIFYQQSETLNTDITASQVDKVASEIRDAADEVYYLGIPSKKTVNVYIPKSVQNITIGNRNIVFVVDSPDGDFEIVKWTAGNLTGTMKVFAGIHRVVVEAQANDVRITDT